MGDVPDSSKISSDPGESLSIFGVSRPIPQDIEADVTFTAFVKSALLRSRMSINEFSRRLGKTSSGNLTSIINGTPVNRMGTIARPPLEEMSKWAEILGLDAPQMAELVELAELCHAPPALRARYLAMRQGTVLSAPPPAPAPTPAVTPPVMPDPVFFTNEELILQMGKLQAELARRMCNPAPPVNRWSRTLDDEEAEDLRRRMALHGVDEDSGSRIPAVGQSNDP